MWELCRVIPEDMVAVRAHMLEHGHGHNVARAHERVDENDGWTGLTWAEKELKSSLHVTENVSW